MVNEEDLSQFQNVKLWVRRQITTAWTETAPNALKLMNNNRQTVKLQPEYGKVLTPHGIEPCLLEAAGGVLKTYDNQQNTHLVFSPGEFSPWQAVFDQGDNYFEVADVRALRLGRRKAVAIAGAILEKVCGLCPFQDLCDRKVKPYWDVTSNEENRYYPGVIVNH